MQKNKGKVLWVDTEQGKPECVKTIRVISKLVNGDENKHPENLYFLSLRQYNAEQRLFITDAAIKYFEGVSLVIIDGIRDFVSSINDEKEATKVTDKLLKWTQEKNIHIITILHQNKGDSNARGHLGSELMNKAETVAKLSREDSPETRLTIIEPGFTRHKEFEKFAFSLDENGNLIAKDAVQGYQEKNPKVHELTHYQIEALLRSTFEDGTPLTYGPLWNRFKTVLKDELKVQFGDKKCKDLITFLKEKHYLNHDTNLKVYSAHLPPK